MAPTIVKISSKKLQIKDWLSKVILVERLK